MTFCRGNDEKLLRSFVIRSSQARYDLESGKRSTQGLSLTETQCKQACVLKHLIQYRLWPHECSVYPERCSAQLKLKWRMCVLIVWSMKDRHDDLIWLICYQLYIKQYIMTMIKCIWLDIILLVMLKSCWEQAYILFGCFAVKFDWLSRPNGFEFETAVFTNLFSLVWRSYMPSFMKNGHNLWPVEIYNWFWPLSTWWASSDVAMRNNL